MTKLARVIHRFAHSEEGATTVEYGIAIVVMAGIAIFVVTQLNVSLAGLYEKFATKIGTVN